MWSQIFSFGVGGGAGGGVLDLATPFFFARARVSSCVEQLTPEGPYQTLP